MKRLLILLMLFAAIAVGALLSPIAENPAVLAQTNTFCAANLPCQVTALWTFSSINKIIVVDGTVNTTVQAALNAVTSPGSEVFVPCGTYTIAAGLTWPSLPVNLHGEDRNCTILNFTITSGSAMSPWYGSSVHGFDIRGANSGTAIAINGGAAVWTLNTAYTTANNNISPTLANANGLIFKETVASCTSSNSTEPTWPTVLGGTVSDNTCSWTAAYPAAKNIYDNIIEQWGGQCYNAGGFSYGDDVHDNIMRGGLTECCLLGANSQKIIVSNNTFDNFASDGVDINGIKHTVIGNHFSRIGQASVTADRTAINLSSLSTTVPLTDIKIIGNDIHQAGTGIHLTGINGASMSRVVIQGNQIDTPTGTAAAGDGIDLDCNSGTTMVYNDTVISGNTVVNAQRYGYCINIGVGPAVINNTILTNNTARTSTTADLNLTGATATYVAGNQFLSATPYVLSDSTFSTIWGQNNPATANVDSSFLNNNFLWWRNGAANAGLLILGVDSSNQVQLRGGGGANSLTFLSQAGATRAVMPESGAWSFPVSIAVGAGSAVTSTGAGGTMAALIANGTSTLTANATLGAGTCQTAITTSATGAATTDSIEWSFATAPATGDAISPVASYVTANNVNFTRCNPTAAAQNVTAIVINWRVLR